MSMASEFDDTAASVAYTGTWSAQTGVTGAFQNTLHSTSQAGAKASVGFTGNVVRVYGSVPPCLNPNGPPVIIGVSLDNATPVQTSQACGRTVRNNVLFYTVGPLVNNRTIAGITHQIDVINQGTTPFRLDVIRTDYEAPADGTPVTTSLTPASSTVIGTTSAQSSAQVGASLSTSGSSGSNTQSATLSASISGASNSALTTAISSKTALGDSTVAYTIVTINGVLTSVPIGSPTSTGLGGNIPIGGDATNPPNLTGGPTGHTSSIGPIIGGIVAAVIILIILIVFLLRRRSRRMESAKMSNGNNLGSSPPRAADTTVVPFNLSGDPSSQSSNPSTDSIGLDLNAQNSSEFLNEKIDVLAEQEPSVNGNALATSPISHQLNTFPPSPPSFVSTSETVPAYVPNSHRSSRLQDADAGPSSSSRPLSAVNAPNTTSNVREKDPRIFERHPGIDAIPLADGMTGRRSTLASRFSAAFSEAVPEYVYDPTGPNHRTAPPEALNVRASSMLEMPPAYNSIREGP